MKRILNKLCLSAVVISLIGSNTVGFAASTDYADNWAKGAIEKWMGYNIVGGYPDGSFKPSNQITRAEFAKVITSTLGLKATKAATLSDVAANHWAKDAIDAVYEYGFMVGANNTFRPEEKISRQETATVLAKAFKVGGSAETTTAFNDANSVSDWALKAVSQMNKLGYINGYADGSFKPLANVTRAEAVTMLNNLAGDVISKPGEYTGTYKNLIINSTNVTLKNAKITGNLVIAEGVGNGDVNLDNVTVAGETIVKGGGVNSIKITNSTLSGPVLVLKVGGGIRLVAIGSTSIPNVMADINGAGSFKLVEENLTGNGFGKLTVLQPGQEIELAGNFDFVDVQASNVTMSVVSGTVGKVEIPKNATGVDLNVAAGAIVKLIDTDAQVDVTGTGTVEKAILNASGSTFQTAPTTVTSENSNTTYTAGGTAVTAPTTVTGPTTPPPPATGGSTGGGGTSGGDGTTTQPGISLNGVTLKGIGNTTYENASVTGSGTTLNVAITGNQGIESITLNASSGLDSFVITNVAGSNLTVTDDKTISGNTIGMGQLFPVNDNNVYPSSLKALFGNTVTISGTAYKTGYTNTNVTISLTFTPVTATFPTNNYFTFAQNGDVIEATMKSGIANMDLTDGNAVSVFSVLASLVDINGIQNSGSSVVFEFTDPAVMFTFNGTSSMATITEILTRHSNNKMSDLANKPFTVTYKGATVKMLIK